MTRHTTEELDPRPRDRWGRFLPGPQLPPKPRGRYVEPGDDEFEDLEDEFEDDDLDEDDEEDDDFDEDDEDDEEEDERGWR